MPEMYSLGRAFTLLILISIFSWCQPSRIIDLSGVDAKVNIHRFDEALFALDTSNFSQDFAKLQESEFSLFFEGNNAEPFWRNQRTLDFMVRLHEEVKNKFPDIENLEKNIRELHRHYRYFYRGTDETIEIFTYISGLDFDFPVIYVDSITTAFIALDLFLGQEHPAYARKSEYLNFHHNPEQITVKLAEQMLHTHIRKDAGDMSLINDMVYHGKMLYALLQLLPHADERLLLNYSSNHTLFCKENERTIWRYFIEQDILFDQRAEFKRRFIDPAPFSKFYMEFDNLTPGQIGQWVGLQIVKSYMRRNQGKELKDLLHDRDHRTIFAESGYKP
jgi:hypothetical protein